jgi:flagellar hook-associated protein 3 FlgL
MGVAVRVTHKLLYDTVSFNLRRNQDQLYRTSEQLVSGRRINRPSDDPVGASRAVTLHKTLSRFDQFDNNNDRADSYLVATETALDHVKDSLYRTRDLVMQQLSANRSPESQQAAAAEIHEIRAAVLQAANTKSDDRFIFSGYLTRTEAFDSSGVFQGGAGNEIEVEISDGDFLAMNTTGDEVFVDSGTGQSVIEFLDQVEALVLAGDETGLQDSLPQLETWVNKVLGGITNVGARVNRLETAKSDNEDLRVQAETQISKIEDLDYVEASAKYSEQERVLQATMETSSRMMSMSILDFLK